MRETKKSFCRFCHVFCGVEVDVEDGRVLEVRGDRDNPVTRGYTCPKGRAEPERIHHPERLLAARKRVGDAWHEIGKERALDEIADKLRGIIDRHGPDSVAVYTGCGGHRTSAGGPWFVRRFLDALGSSRMYTSFTIDSPSLAVAGQRFFGGPFPANLLDVERADVAMFVGTNPIASHQLNMSQSAPAERVHGAQRRGMKLIVVDPRRSDSARRADLHLQVKPGEDATLLAAMLKLILDRGWQDHDYVSKYLSGVDALHEALGDFDLDYAATRTGVEAEKIEAAARMFASARSGGAISGTGLHMAPHHNLATQLVMTLNGLCGRVDRPGGLARSEGPLGRRFDASMGPSVRAGEPPKSRVRNIPATAGLFGSYWELPTNTLADEILTPGAGQIRALVVNGGNPALVLSEERSALAALESLELLVVSDLFMSATAKLADYVLAAKHPFERADVTKLMDGSYPFPFGQYTPPLVEPPTGVLEEFETFFGLAGRLGLPLRVGPLTAERVPSADELLDAQFARARIPLSELRKHPSGWVSEERTMSAGGVMPNLLAHPDQRMAAGHSEVLRELREVRAEPLVRGAGYRDGERFAFRLITYRMKEVYCTQGQNLPSLARKRSYNPVLMHAEAMRALGIRDGDVVAVESGYGRVEAIAEASDQVGRETIALAFGWGDPLDPRGLREKGANVQRLIPDDELYDPVTGLARQSALAVNVARVG